MLKKRVLILGICFSLVTYSAAHALFGHHAPIPGVDIPVNPPAFWDPDIPDYQDDGNIYSLKELSKGSVYDHMRHVDNSPTTIKLIADVANSLTQIANQLLNLKGTDETILNANSSIMKQRLDQIGVISEQNRGILNQQNTTEVTWSQYFKDPKPSNMSTNERIEFYKSLALYTDLTGQDSLTMIQNQSQSTAEQQVMSNLMRQNYDAEGNKQAKQVTTQLQAVKTSQIISKNQMSSALLAIMAMSNSNNQKENDNRVHTRQSISIGSVDPYNPTEQDKKLYENPKPQGFINY